MLHGSEESPGREPREFGLGRLSAARNEPIPRQVGGRSGCEGLQRLAFRAARIPADAVLADPGAALGYQPVADMANLVIAR
jgi:hypothetical protein